MVKFALQFKANLENITRVRPLGDDFRWFLKLKCGNCGEVSDRWQYITLMDSVPLKGGRGSASMVQKCKLCSRENSIDILRTTLQPYNAEDNERFKTIVEFECRGLEPIDFQPQGTLVSYIDMPMKKAKDCDHTATPVTWPKITVSPCNSLTNAGFVAEGAETGTPFNDINLQEKDWTDYDEKAQESVGIYEVTHQFKKC